MSAVIERVARALCAEDMVEMLRAGMAANAGSPLEVAFAVPGAIDELWPNYERAARTAIEAMRHAPGYSTTMTERGVSAARNAPFDINGQVGATQVGAAWHDMIDEALQP